MKVGDYVRTKDGKIFKWSKLCTIDVSDWMEHTRKILFVQDEIKSSPNIIDLIEKSDLVVDNYGNIYVVDYVFDNYVYTTTKQGNIVKTLCDYQIKSIVTKEQFEAMQYNLESDVN